MGLRGRKQPKAIVKSRFFWEKNKGRSVPGLLKGSQIGSVLQAGKF